MAASSNDQYLDNEGYIEGEKIRAEAIKEAKLTRLAASVAAAILNAYELVANFRKQRDIMRRSRKIAQDLHNKMKDYYWPKELEYLYDCCNPEELEDVDKMGRRYAGRLKADLARTFNQQINKIKCNASRYCTSAKEKMIQDIMLERGKAMGNAMILGYKMAFEEWQARDDLNIERRLQAIALGQGLVNQAGSFMKSSSGALSASMAGNMGSFNSALSAIGYSTTAGDNINYHDEAMAMARKAGATSPTMPGTTGTAAAATAGSPTDPTDPTTMKGGNAANNLNSAGRYTNITANALQASGSNLGAAVVSNSDDNGTSAFGYSNATASSSNQLINSQSFNKAVDSATLGDIDTDQIAMESEQKNQGVTGNRSLARYGAKTYIDFDSKGKMLKAPVDMEDFSLLYSDPDHARSANA